MTVSPRAGWSILRGEEGRAAHVAEDLKSVSEESDFDGPFIDYKAKGNQIELIGKEELKGKPLPHQVDEQERQHRFYLFDATSFLPAKWEETRVVEGKETPWESFFSDYREVNGVKYAFQIDSDSPGRT